MNDKTFIPKNLPERLFIDNSLLNTISVYFELKYLFVNSIIYSENKRKPYKKLAEHLQISESGLRAKLKFLENKKLIRYDNEKNLHLCNLNKIQQFLKIKFKRKYCFKKSPDIKFKHYLQYVAISENYKKQNYKLIQKIIAKEYGIDLNNMKKCNEYKTAIMRKFTKHLKKNLAFYLTKWDKVYYSQFNQIEFKMPEVNTTITLSCKGFANLFNKQAESSGWYITDKLMKLGLCEIYRRIVPLKDKSSAIFEKLIGVRSDVFDDFHVKSKIENTKHYLSLTNKVTLLEQPTI